MQPFGRLVGELVGLHVVELAQRHAVEAELLRHDVDDPLDQPQVLQARVAAVGPTGHLFVSVSV